ncbi:MAG: hypothetical protein AAFX10_13175 [Pseudomonadota bacterium]
MTNRIITVAVFLSMTGSAAYAQTGVNPGAEDIKPTPIWYTP